jgi:hypothetical protein
VIESRQDLGCFLEKNAIRTIHKERKGGVGWSSGLGMLFKKAIIRNNDKKLWGGRGNIPM